MLGKILQYTLPGGLPLLEAVGVGLAAGLDPSLQSSHVVNIDDTGNPLKPNVTITPRTSGSLLSGHEVVSIGLQHALLIPQAAAGLVQTIPAAAYAIYEPIKNLGDVVSNPFRQGTLPRITGQEGQPTLGELIQDALAGARVPVGIPPNPLGPQGSLGAIAALLLKGLIPWGQINGPERKVETTGFDPEVASTRYVSGGLSIDGRDLAVGTYNMGIYGPAGWVPGHSFLGFVSGPPASNTNIPSSLQWRSFTTSPHPSSGPGARAIRYDRQTSSGSIIFGQTTPSDVSYFPFSKYSLRFEIANPQPGAQLVETNQPVTTTSPWLNPPEVSEVEPASLEEEGQPALVPPAPLILPLSPDPVPGSTPVEPDPATLPDTPGSPSQPATPGPVITPTLPRPFAPPWIQPNTPTAPGSVPGQFPSNPTQPTQPTAPDGTVTPTRPGPVTQTQPGSIVPWPGAPSIPAIGPAPRADLVGIAQEVGRIERKLDLMNTPTSTGNLIDLLGEARRLAEAIWELLTSLSAGTTYTLDSPCEVDGEGVKLPPIEIEAAGATSAFGVLMNRTDALAELIQAHKNLKQPGCKHKLAGEIVTVNFQQIE